MNELLRDDETYFSTQRKVLNFNTHWKWIDRDIPGGESPYLNEEAAGATEITIPHSHALTGLTSLDPGCFQYKSWYRRHFSIPGQYAGKRVRVQFHGTSQIAKVYVNGRFVSIHRGTYTPFIVDITDYITIGESEDNLIAVKIDAVCHPEIPPEGNRTDYFIYGGMTRDINLIISNPLYIDDVFVFTQKGEGFVNIICKATAINKSNEFKVCTVRTYILDAGNNVISSAESEMAILEGSLCTFHMINTVENPVLWSPDNPYLYKVKTQIFAGGICLDEIYTKTGIRWVYFDPPGTKNGKFYLNDQALKLRGTNFHNVFPYVGLAAPKRLHRKDAHVIKYEMGMNFVRAAHYPVSPEFLDECDKVGLLVVEEAPGWQFVGGCDWKAQFENMLRELIVRDRNHPSIIMWNVKVNESDGDDAVWYSRTNTIAKGLDPTRPTCGIDRRDPKAFVTDVFSLTDYTEMNGRVPSRQPWITGEFNGHGPFSRALTFVFPNDSEYYKLDDMLGESSMLEFMLSRSDIAGFANWVLYDYLTPENSHPGHRTYQHSNLRCPGSFGILRTPKWNSYLYKSQATYEQVGDVLFIASEWKEDASSTIYVVSNCEQVELLKNGESLGGIDPNAFTGLTSPLFRWEGVIWESGSNLVAKGYRDRKVVVQDVRNVPCIPVSVKLTSTCADRIYADGSDATWVTAELRDENGQRIYDGDENIELDITGPGEIIIPENPAMMMDGYAGFYIRSRLNENGKIRCRSSVDVGIVIPDSCSGRSVGTIEYSGHWLHTGADSGNESYTCTYDGCTDEDFFLVRFSGVQIKLYGVTGVDNGIAAISIDGGEETDVDYFGVLNRRHVNVYVSPILIPGTHELKVRAKMEKHVKSSGFAINVEYVKVHTGEYTIYSNELEITAVPVEQKNFVLQPNLPVEL